MSYLPFVDGLRAVAVTLVLLFHAFPNAVPGGFIGVDVFFVISGFLITRFIAGDLQSGDFSLARFFIRRARRLLPAALVCFSLVTILAAFILLPDAFLYHGRSLLGAVLMYANIFFYRTGGYFSAPSLEKPLLHTWSLAVEDQFYLTWPLLLMLILPRLSRNAVLAIVVVLFGLSLTCAQVQVLRDSDFAFYMLPSRAWELLGGAFIALTPGLERRIPSYACEILGIAGLVSIISSAFILSPDWPFPGISAAPACLGAVAILVSGISYASLAARLLSLRPLVFLGLLSYSLYLWHWPLISLASYYNEQSLAPPQAGAVLSASVFLAYLSWRFVERPFRVAPHTPAETPAGYGHTRFIVGAFAAVTCVAAMAGVIKVTKGAPERYSSGVRTVLDQMVASNPWRQGCDNYEMIFSNDDFCNFGRKKAPAESYEIAMFGDSMADHWVPLVAQHAERTNLAGRQVTNGGCAFLTSVEIPATPTAKARECARYQQEAIRFVEANPKLKIAVLSGYWQKWLQRVPPKALSDTVEFFTKRGIRVVLLGQIPVYGSLPLRCVAANIDGGGDLQSCGMTATSAAIQLKLPDETLQQIAELNPMVSLFLPSTVMCKSGRCPLVSDGVMLYKNEGHLNRFGATYLGQFVTFPKLD